MIVPPKDLAKLRTAFVERGFDLRYVGGCVRDHALGLEPKDFDLCTDAEPAHQLAIYRALDLQFYETGIAHGTISVKLGSGLYEITSLREDIACDGRHAEVAYTRDWDTDLRRRDLTINAMSQTFDGALVDPFGGFDDLMNHVVRFVGRPEERMQEDYLRILRWLRFHGRFGGESPLDFQAQLAAMDLADGLNTISRERVWMEMAKIIVGPRAPYLLHYIGHMGLWPHMGIVEGPMHLERVRDVRGYTQDPVTVMVALMGGDSARVRAIAETWKWSRVERKKGEFLAQETGGYRTNLNWLRGYFGHPKELIVDLAHLRQDHKAADAIEAWEVPTFPVTGADLIALGHTTGPELGDKLTDLRCHWAGMGYTMTKEEILRTL